MNFFSVGDVMKAWESLSSNVLSITGNRKYEGDVDHSFITPTIIALGDFDQSQCDQLVQLTNGDPVVIWNLGGRPLSEQVKATFDNQVIDVQWKTTCKYTKAPILECIFGLCRSIKAWYDLNDKNLAVIYCPSGSPNSGILIACLMKYIGAFDHTSQAYDYYCGKRLKTDRTHSLAPSYRNLFENVDRVVDTGGYQNNGAMHLKALTVAGLPVEEMPCVEVWDTSGLVFSSHAGGRTGTNMCTWDPDYGSGWFRVSHDILGDFSIVCCFGGHLANSKDKSTLIFKYQTSTAFLPHELIALKQHHVDVNPHYADSLEVDTFAVHLMFEPHPDDSAARNSSSSGLSIVSGASGSTIGVYGTKGDPLIGMSIGAPTSAAAAIAAEGAGITGAGASKNSRKLLPYFPRPGLESFEIGLDEISRMHRVVPDAKKIDTLREKVEKFDFEHSTKYASVALQLANNRDSYAAELVDMMQSRELILAPMGSTVDPNAPLADGDISDVESTSTWEIIDTPTICCPVCHDDSASKANMLVPCSLCKRQYHSVCVGLKRPPSFGNKSDTDKKNRDTYIKHHYGTWVCKQCAALGGDDDAAAENKYGGAGNNSNEVDAADRELYGVVLTPQNLARFGAQSLSEKSPLGSLKRPVSTSYVSPKPNTSAQYGGGVIVTDQLRTPINGKTPQDLARTPHTATKLVHSPVPNGRSPMNGPSKHDQIAMLVGMLSTSGVTIESLVQMSEEKQRETLIAVAKHKLNLTDENDNKNKLDLSTALKGILAKHEPSAEEQAAAAAQQGEGRHALAESLLLLQRVEGDAGGASNLTPATKKQMPDSNADKVQAKDHPHYKKFFRMLSVGLSLDAVKKKIIQEGLNPKVVDLKPTDLIPLIEPEPEAEPEFIPPLPAAHQGYPHPHNKSAVVLPGTAGADAAGNSPLLEKKGSLARVGSMSPTPGGGANSPTRGPPDAVSAARKKMLDRIQSKKAVLDGSTGVGAGTGTGTDRGTGTSSAVADGSSNGEGSATVDNGLPVGSKVPKIREVPELAKYFKMMKVGIPKQSIAEKLVAEGYVGNVQDGIALLGMSLDDTSPYGEFGPKGFAQRMHAAMAAGGIGAHQGAIGAGGGGLGGPGDGSGGGGGGIGGPGGPGGPGGWGQGPGGPGTGPGGWPLGTDGGPGGPGVNPLGALSAMPGMWGAPGGPQWTAGTPGAAGGGGGPGGAGTAGPVFGVDGKPLSPRSAEEHLQRHPSQRGRMIVPEFIVLCEHPKYSKYFKMLQVGLGKEEIKEKMKKEGVDPDMLDKDPNMMVPWGDFTKEKLAEAEKKNENMVAVKDHPKYAKYFKMLKFGLPKDAVKNKMTQEGVNPDMIDKDPEELIPVDDEKKKKDVEMVEVGKHPKYEKFFKMLKVGIPIPAVKIKVTQEGLDANMMDKDPTELIPLSDEPEEEEDQGEMVKVSEHPAYAKFFKMLKVGIPAPAIKPKMRLENLNEDYIDKDPDEMVPLEEKKKKEEKKKPVNPLAGLGKKKKEEENKVRKKKLHWKALDASKVSGSLWADSDMDGIMLDEEEFNMLFVESAEAVKEEEEKKKKAKAAAKTKEIKTKVVLIDGKRAQNAGIALARIKTHTEKVAPSVVFNTVREKVMAMDDSGLTTDQLKALEEYLPTMEETGQIKAYSGPEENLGQAELYMKIMSDIRTKAPSRIACMVYKQQFKARALECRSNLSKVENACDDVKMSVRLKKVLKIVLKVGNQLNDGEASGGFSVESLLKLSTAKAFDKKTSVLQYVIMLIHRNDEDALQFPEDLKNVSDASRLKVETIVKEKEDLRKEFDKHFANVMEISENEPENNVGSMIDFLTKAETQCNDLEKRTTGVKTKFTGVLNYFGEDPAMTSESFFSTLDKFVREFVTTRDMVERQRKAEERKRAAALEKERQHERFLMNHPEKATEEEKEMLAKKAAQRAAEAPEKASSPEKAGGSPGKKTRRSSVVVQSSTAATKAELQAAKADLNAMLGKRVPAPAAAAAKTKDAVESGSSGKAAAAAKIDEGEEGAGDGAPSNPAAAAAAAAAAKMAAKRATAAAIANQLSGGGGAPASAAEEGDTGNSPSRKDTAKSKLLKKAATRRSSIA